MKPIRYPARSLLLNVGCGRHYHPEWCNLDMGAPDPQVLRHDIRRGLPFADESFGAIYHSHLLEHLAPESGRQFLRECLRVLRPGGVMRIVVPDLEIIASLYLEKLRRIDRRREQTVADYRWMTLELLDQMVRDRSGGLMGQYMTDPHIVNSDFVRARIGHEYWISRTALADGVARAPHGALDDGLFSRVAGLWRRARHAAARHLVRWLLGRDPERAFAAGLFREQGEIHRWMYDRFSLGELVSELGFIHYRICGPQTSSIPDFHRYQLDTVDAAVRKPDSLYVECQRPAPRAAAAA